MNDLDRKLIELFDANRPATRITTYRQKLDELESVTKLEPARLTEIRAFVTERLDSAEKIMQREDWNREIVQHLLEESRHALINAIHEPNAKRGAKTLAAARAGHEAVHGSPDEKREERERLQSITDDVARSNPALSWNAIQHRAGDRAGVSYKTIQRHCKNPKES